MPGTKYNSIQNVAMYRALRRRGYSKEAAARISNARTPGHTVKASGVTGLAIPPHGPNALLNQPGIEGVGSVRSRRRKRREKATRITGNLFRGDNGKFQAGGAGGSAKPAGDEPKKPAQEKPDRAAERDAALAKEEEIRAAEDAAVEAEPSAKKRQLLRRQNAANRRKRAAERRTQEREAQAADREARETESGAKKLAAEEAKRQREQAKLAEEKKPKGGGGGGGKAPKPTEDEKQREAQAKKQQAARDTAKTVGLPDGAADLLTEARDEGGVSDPRLVNMGLVGADGLATDQGRRALGALERGDVGGYRAAVQDAQKRLEREAQAQVRSQEQARLRTERDKRTAERDEEERKKLEARGRRDAPVEGARQRSRRYQQYLVRQGLQRRKEKAAIVPTRTTSAGHTGVMVALYPDAAAAQTIAGLDGVTEDLEQLHLTLAYLGNSSEFTQSNDKARLIAAIQQWALEHGKPLQGTINGLGRFFNAESDGTNAVYVSPDVAGLPELRQSLCSWVEKSGLEVASNHGFTPHITVAYVPEAAPTPDIRPDVPVSFATVTLAWGDEQYEFPLGIPTGKSFVTYKNAAGLDCWLAITTTAYEDKDGEWITRKAIRNLVEAGPYGPLRYWHVPGMDIGDCTFNASAFDDRVLIEGGTFRSKAAARIGREAARRGYEMSPGFLHSRKEPRGGAFEHIAQFERSFVPPGRASNPYTRLRTKETRMTITDEKRQEWQTLASDPAGRQLLTELLTQAETTVKEADARGAIYKEAPAWAQALISEVQALGVRVKEVETKASMPPGEMIAAGETELTDGELELDAANTPAADVADELMSDDAFADLVADKVIGKLGPQLDLEGKMAKWAGEIKSSIPGAIAQKDDARGAEIATLKARIDELEGGQPRSFNRQVWGDLTGHATVTKEQAAAITATSPQAVDIPDGLTEQERGAYALLFGEQ